ncbi:hypothetical protein GN956_G13704, partial [Arapaima gigas]
TRHLHEAVFGFHVQLSRAEAVHVHANFPRLARDRREGAARFAVPCAVPRAVAGGSCGGGAREAGAQRGPPERAQPRAEPGASPGRP